MLKVVVDTNIIVSALLKPGSNPALVISLLFQGRFSLCLTAAIFDEYEGGLARDKFKALDQEKVKLFLAKIKEAALWSEPRKKVELIKDDVDDNKFLECALEADANYLITGNTKHFPFPKFKKTRVLSSLEFIQIIAKPFFE